MAAGMLTGKSGGEEEGRQLSWPRTCKKTCELQREPWCGWSLLPPAVGVLFQGTVPVTSYQFILALGKLQGWEDFRDKEQMERRGRGRSIRWQVLYKQKHGQKDFRINWWLSEFIISQLCPLSFRCPSYPPNSPSPGVPVSAKGTSPHLSLGEGCLPSLLCQALVMSGLPGLDLV